MRKDKRQSKELRNRFYTKNRFNLFMAILGTTILSIAILSVPILMQQVIDLVAGSSQSNWKRLLCSGIMIIIMKLCSGICTYYFRTTFSTKAILQYREYAFKVLMQKDIQGFANKSSAIYTSALINDISSIKENYLDMIPIISQIVICCIGAIIMMANKCYIIVGNSGSGKSTLLKLVMKMLENYNGGILYDTIDIKNVSNDEIFSRIAYIQQETVIFDTSILNNITMYQQFSDEQVNVVINQSGLDELVKNRGLEYVCGENGMFLSGGERQRIAIARSLIRKTNVLLADEVTASLDKNTAFQVLSSIVALKDITKVLVLHDLNENILKNADEIIALKNGYIVDKGTFNELIDRKGYFYSLFAISE